MKREKYQYLRLKDSGGNDRLLILAPLQPDESLLAEITSEDKFHTSFEKLGDAGFELIQVFSCEATGRCNVNHYIFKRTIED